MIGNTKPKYFIKPIDMLTADKYWKMHNLRSKVEGASSFIKDEKIIFYYWRVSLSRFLV